jgi:cell division protein FtsI (penicillin-binding protein 3)
MIFGRRHWRGVSRIQGERSAALEQARGRIIMLSIFFMVAYGIVAIRALDISVFNGGQSSRLAMNADDVARGIKSRGEIRDRNGVLLAKSLPSVSLYVDPSIIIGADQLARDLVKIFPNHSYGDVLQKLQSPGRFTWIQRNISPAEQYEVLKLGQPGLGFEKEVQRIYPQGNLTAHLVGYANVDGKGLAGVERSFDNYLGEGEDLTLTLDVRLQHVLHREVTRAMHEFSAKAGTGVIMDVRSGEIVAGVSLPDFNPHDAGNAGQEEIFNRLTLGVYELGSMFKIFSTAAVLELKQIPLGYTFDATKPIKVGRFTINDYHAENRIMTVPEVFMYSSNIGSALMGQLVGTKALKNFYDDLGLLRPLQFEISEIGRPLMPNPWKDLNTLTASYGHGVATTPLQMATAVATVLNDGFLVKPRLVIPQDDESGHEKVGGEVRVLSEETSHKMRSLMRLVVTDGTGSKADVAGYDIGGKTGTAEKIGPDGRYQKKKLISSFVGAFPSSDPRYVIMVTIDEPVGNKQSYGYATAGWVAAPAVGRIVSSLASILGLEPDKKPAEQDSAAPLRHYIALKSREG